LAFVCRHRRAYPTTRVFVCVRVCACLPVSCLCSRLHLLQVTADAAAPAAAASAGYFTADTWTVVAR